MAGMTEKQKKFADFYIQSGNATQSYLRAGYKAKDDNIAGVEGHKLLKNPKVLLYVDERNKELESNRIADIAEVKEFWTNALRDQRNEMKDRLKASEYLAKSNGAFLDKVEMTGEGGGPLRVIFNIPRPPKEDDDD